MGQAACGTCHSLPPGAPHPARRQPAPPATARSFGADGGFVNPALHINGLVEANATCGTLPRPAAGHRHARAARRAGAARLRRLDHRRHAPNPTGYAFGCGNCHPVNPARHPERHGWTIELYDPTRRRLAQGAEPADGGVHAGRHGASRHSTLPYTLGTCANVYCHSGPTYATPNVVPAPGVDFPFTGYPVVYPAYTLNVARSYQRLTWGGAAPPAAAAATACPFAPPAPRRQAMAGQSHC